MGFDRLLTDLGSEMVFSVFVVFFTTVAGASSALLGLIEGLADFSASSFNYLAGWLSDRSGKRKVYALAGHGFSTLAKLILLVTSSVVGLGLFRVIERLGKGFRPLGRRRPGGQAGHLPGGRRKGRNPVHPSRSGTLFHHRRCPQRCSL